MDKGKRDRNTSEDGGHIDKTHVLQEAKQAFTANSVKTKKLVDVLTKCIFILLQGERLTNNEATDLFFHMTRLFQYKDKDGTLRRLTYIGIKTLSQQAENVHVVTSTLTTDVNSSRDDPAIRASALRALCQISDASSVTSIERYLRQSVVDKHPVVASAALTSLIRIARVNGDIVKRCKNEIQEALSSDSPMVQYHALALSYTLCENDRLATTSLLSACIDQRLRSPLATCLLLRIIAVHINDAPDDEDVKKLLSFTSDCLNHSHEMVEYEAANTIVTISRKGISAKIPKLNSSMLHLRNFLSSPRASLRFASLRLLNELSATSKQNIRYWNTHKIGSLCKLHLLTKRYRPGDDIIGILDFNYTISCAKYTVMLQCETIQHFQSKQEFSLGLKKTDFNLSIPQFNIDSYTDNHYNDAHDNNQEHNHAHQTLHCVLTFLFYIDTGSCRKSLLEDKAGLIELGPTEIDTRIFSCDFPLAIYT